MGSRWWALGAALCAGLASLLILMARVGHRTVFQAKGGWAVLALLVPVVIAVFGVVACGRDEALSVARLACVGLWVWTLVFLFWIGLFYVPAAILMTVADRRLRHAPMRRSPARERGLSTHGDGGR